MKYKNFKSALEFLSNYGFEYCYDSATGKRECYKNRFGEIILNYYQLDPNYWIPQICAIISNQRQVIDLEKEYSALGKKRSVIYELIHRITIFDMLYDVAKNDIETTGKVFGILIETKYLN